MAAVARPPPLYTSVDITGWLGETVQRPHYSVQGWCLPEAGNPEGQKVNGIGKIKIKWNCEIIEFKTQGWQFLDLFTQLSRLFYLQIRYCSTVVGLFYFSVMPTQWESMQEVKREWMLLSNLCPCYRCENSRGGLIDCGKHHFPSTLTSIMDCRWLGAIYSQ